MQNRINISNDLKLNEVLFHVYSSIQTRWCTDMFYFTMGQCRSEGVFTPKLLLCLAIATPDLPFLTSHRLFLFLLVTLAQYPPSQSHFPFLLSLILFQFTQINVLLQVCIFTEVSECLFHHNIRLKILSMS